MSSRPEEKTDNPFEKEPEGCYLFRLMWDCIKRFKTLLFLILIVSLVSLALAFIHPKFWGRYVDGLIQKQMVYSGVLGWAIITVLGVIIGHGIMRWLNALLGQSVVEYLTSDTYGRAQKLSMAFHRSSYVGEIAQRVLGDPSVMVQAIHGSHIIVIALLRFVGTAIILTLIHPRLTLACAPAPLVFFVVFLMLYNKLIQPRHKEAREERGLLSAMVYERVAAIGFIQAHNAEDREQARICERVRKCKDASMRTVSISALFLPLISFFTILAQIVAAIYGGTLVVSGDLSVGGMIAYMVYLQQLYNPVRECLQIADQLNAIRPAARKITIIRETQPTVQEPREPVRKQKWIGGVEVSGLDFAFDGALVLRRVGLRVRPGEIVGLVGRSGAGKSTLKNLLWRCDDPVRGTIRIDGVPINRMRFGDLRGRVVGIVDHRTTILTGTLAENITYGKPGASMKEIVAASRAAQLHSEIMEMSAAHHREVLGESAFRRLTEDEQVELAYGIRLGSGGIRLSDGQSQRLALARIFVSRPAVVVFDEATSCVDSENIMAFLDAIRKELRGCTIIYIAHALYNLKYVDRVVVLDAGEIVEQGTHFELLADNGVYAGLVRTQQIPINPESEREEAASVA